MYCLGGLPQEFFRVPSKLHIALWREGARRARIFGRYPAPLVSFHAETIYAQYFNFTKAEYFGSAPHSPVSSSPASRFSA